MSAFASHLAIPRLIYTYAELIDSGDFAGVGDLFANATILVAETGLEVTGRDEIRAMYEDWVRIYPDNNTPHTRHVTTNLILDVDEEAGTATCRSYITVFHHTDTGPLHPILSGRYHDHFTRTDNIWHFTHRQMINEYRADLTTHLKHPFIPDSIT